MENVLRVLFSGMMFMLSGFMFGTVFWSRYERKFREKLSATKGDLTEPESYIWVNVDDRLPTRSDVYVVEYCFGDSGSRYYSAHRFDVRENRFEYEGYKDLKVIRWAELPR